MAVACGGDPSLAGAAPRVVILRSAFRVTRRARDPAPPPASARQPTPAAWRAGRAKGLPWRS